MPRSFFAVVSLLVLVSFALAQQPATIQGTVTDPSGAVIANVTITVRNTDTGKAMQVRSDVKGRFSVSGLAGGNYSVTASQPGFAEVQIQDLALAAGQILNRDVTLHISSVTESISVQAGTDLVIGATEQPSQQQVFDSEQTVRVLDRAQMAVLGPVAGGSQIISLTPGANVVGYGNTGSTKYTVQLNGINQGWGGYGGFTGGGSLGITFDGIPIVDPATSLWPSGTIPQGGMIQDTAVTYGPGDPMTRWYTSVGGAVEFTPMQPTNKAHGDVTFTYGSYNQKNMEFNLASGLYHGWSDALSFGIGSGDDFRKGIDGFNNYGKNYAAYDKAVKVFDQNSFSIGGYFAYAGGYRPQVIPTVANPAITVTGQPSGEVYSQQTSGFYSTLPYASYNKYDVNQIALIDAKQNIHLDDTTTLQNMVWYMHIRRLHARYNDVYSLGPQEGEYNSPHTNTIGDQIVVQKKLAMNDLALGGYYIHALYNTRQNFYSFADGGSPGIVNIGGKIRSGYFDQDNFAVFVQDDFHPTSIVRITPGIRYVGFQTAYSNAAQEDFTFVPGVVLNQRQCPLYGGGVGNVKDQGANCAAHEQRTGVEPSVDASVRATSWMSVYGGFLEQLRAPEMGGGGGLFQSVDPSSYHLSRGRYSQFGFKIHREGTGWQNRMLFGSSIYYQTYSEQEIDIGLSNGDTIAANGASAYRGLNMFFDDDPVANLHLFANANIERAMYTSYVVGYNSGSSCVPAPGQATCQYNGFPVPYVPDSTVNLGANYHVRAKGIEWEPMAALQFVGSQHIFNNQEAAPSTQTMPAYATVNASLGVPYRFMNFSVNGLNLLNRKYNEYEWISSGGYFGTPTGGYTLAYPAAPITVYGSVTLKF